MTRTRTISPDVAHAAADRGATTRSSTTVLAPAPTASTSFTMLGVSGLVGLGATAGLFVFLGWLQPTLDGSEKIAVADIVKIQLAPQTKAPPPPPPPEEEPPPKKQAPRQKPQTAQKSLSQRTSGPRPLRQPRLDAPRVQPEIASALQGVGDLLGGPGMSTDLGLAIAVDAEVEETLYEQLELAEYRRQRQEMAGSSHAEWAATMQSVAQVSEPRFAHQPKPLYPIFARKNKIEGDVCIRVLVDAEGRVTRHEILYSSHETLARALEEILDEWRFAPATDGRGRPIEFWTEFVYEFNLRDAR